VWLVRSGSSYRALSTTCPHAGCAVDWSEAERAFVCPCHDSRFGLDGTRTAGPSPRDLDALPIALDGGRVQVTWRRFRPGTSRKDAT
jgi:Rieske Fe-S protein